MTETDFNRMVVTDGGIVFRTGYRHQLSKHAIAKSGVRPCSDIHHEYFSIFTDGTILVRRGYAWDGASGPAIDTPGTIYASLFHDVLYQAIRLGLLDPVWRKESDWTYYKLCVAGGVPKVRAYYHYLGLRLGGGVYNNLPDSAYPEKVAP